MSEKCIYILPQTNAFYLKICGVSSEICARVFRLGLVIIQLTSSTCVSRKGVLQSV